MKALDEDLNPVQRNRPTHDGAWDPLVGRGNSRATTFVPNQTTQLLPVARSLLPRPKVGQRVCWIYKCPRPVRRSAIYGVSLSCQGSALVPVARGGSLDLEAEPSALYSLPESRNKSCHRCGMNIYPRRGHKVNSLGTASKT